MFGDSSLNDYFCFRAFHKYSFSILQDVSSSQGGVMKHAFVANLGGEAGHIVYVLSWAPTCLLPADLRCSSLAGCSSLRCLRHSPGGCLRNLPCSFILCFSARAAFTFHTNPLCGNVSQKLLCLSRDLQTLGSMKHTSCVSELWGYFMSFLEI